MYMLPLALQLLSDNLNRVPCSFMAGSYKFDEQKPLCELGNSLLYK